MDADAVKHGLDLIIIKMANANLVIMEWTVCTLEFGVLDVPAGPGRLVAIIEIPDRSPSSIALASILDEI